MKAGQAIGDLAQFVTDAPNLTVVVASEPNGPNSRILQRLQLEDAAASSFRAILAGAVGNKGILTKLADRDLVVYQPGHKPEQHELIHLSLSDATAVSIVVDQVTPVQEAALFTAEDEIIQHLRFYAIVVSGDDGRTALFFRQFSSTRELGNSRFLALIYESGRYSRLDHKVFMFDEDIDCFCWDGEMYIPHVWAFEGIFRYLEGLQELATATIAVVTQRIPIVGGDEFLEMCRGRAAMAKVASISRRPYLATLSMDQVRDAINTLDLDIEVREEHGQAKLVFDSSRERRWLILKLLDDDYLSSVLTQRTYEANSKTEMGD